MDPLWAILTDPSKKNNRWDPAEFFATGDEEIDCLMDSVGALSVTLKRGSALDFGCGVGRLTQALCRYFENCVGIDIAGSMIRLAREYNRFGAHCQYFVSETDDLRMFEDGRFDFFHLLQHRAAAHTARVQQPLYSGLHPRIARDGMAVFQVPGAVAPRPTTPAPDTMFNARITASPSTLPAVAGEKIQLIARVTNSSSQAWPARSASDTRYKFRLGNHWLTTLGEMSQMDDGRTALVADLNPSDEVTLPLTVTAPVEPGEYVLELDMVQENVAWFQDKGSPTCRVPVRVTAPPDSATLPRVARPLPTSSAAGLTPPEMAMYCLPRSTVIDLITAEGARVLDVQDYASAGADIASYRYYVVK